MGPGSFWGALQAFIAVHKLSLVVANRGHSCCKARAPGHAGFSRCGAWAQLPCGVWDLPRSGIESCPLPWQAVSQPLDHHVSPQDLS